MYCSYDETHMQFCMPNFPYSQIALTVCTKSVDKLAVSLMYAELICKYLNSF